VRGSGIRVSVPSTLVTRQASAARPPSGSVRSLAGAIGNRAMLALLQRDVIKSLGAPGGPADWTQMRSGDIGPQYADVATLAQAARLRDVSGTAEKDINFIALGGKVGTAETKPGLNFAAKLFKTARGETGFLDASGTYQAGRMPVTLDGPLPRVAITLTPEAFFHGKDSAVATLRHEMEHAAHMQMMIDRLARWRTSVRAKDKGAKLADPAARSRFDAWSTADKSLSPVDRALVLEEEDTRKSQGYNTELLAYMEGFMAVFHLGPAHPSYALAADYPGAIEELWGAAKRFDAAGEKVRAAALERLAAYYRTVLDAAGKAAFREWLAWLSDHARETPRGLEGADASVAKKVHNDFGPYVDFLARVAAVSSASAGGSRRARPR
jgi:hypothetical protein